MLTRPFSSSFEILEDRIAPAAVTLTYSAVTGALVIDAADNDAHAITIHTTGKNSYRVEGNGTEVDNGETFFDITGKLTSIIFTGGNGADTLTLFNLPALNTFEFNGVDGNDSLTAHEFSVKGLTRINFGAGGGSAYFEGLAAKFGGNVEIDMGEYGDFTSRALKATIAGSVIITGATSAIDISYFELAGDVSTVGKGIVWTGNTGEEHLHLFSALSTTVGKNPATGKAISFLGNGGVDFVEGFGNSIKLGGTVEFDGGADDDLLTFETLALQIAGDFLFTGSTGEDEIEIGPGTLNVTGNANFNLGSDSNEVSLYGRMTFGKALIITSGGAEDYISFGGAFLTVKGALELIGGDGNNEVFARVDSLQAGSLTITGGIDDDDVQVGGYILKVAGTTTIALGDGLNFLEVELSTSTTLAKTVTLTGGSDSDSWSFAGDKLTLGADLIVTGSEGSNTLYFENTTAKIGGPFTYTGGDGVDNLIFQSRFLTFSKDVAVTGGDGLNSVALVSAQTSLLKSLTYTGGADPDFLNINATKLTTGGAITALGNAGPDIFSVSVPVLSAKGNWDFNGGADEDNFSLDADGTLTGDLIVDLGASDTESQNASVSSYSFFPAKLKIAGNLKIKAATTDTTVSGYAENVTISNVSITKDVELLFEDALAAGVVSTVSVENSSIGGNLTIRTGAGADQVNLDVLNSYGAMSIAKITTINLGDGDDQISIGGSSAVGSNNLVRFLGNVTVDGGSGTNTNVNDIFNISQNFFGPKSTKTLLGFI